MGAVTDLLKQNPDLALFLSLAGGYAIGRIPIWKIKLGGICGTLLVALLLGQTGVTLDAGVKELAFTLFIFTLGFTAGPSFFANLNRRSLRYFAFPVVEVVLVLAVTSVAVVVLNLDRGTAAGLLAGGATESAALGTASEAIGKLDLPAHTITTLQANVATAYTISYLCGLVTIVLFTSQIAPLLMRVNLADSARALLRTLGGGTGDDGQQAALPDRVGRVYKVEAAAGRTVVEVEGDLGDDVAVERIDRDGTTVTVAPGTALRAGDWVLLIGLRTEVLQAQTVIGRECGAPDGFDLELVSTDVVFNKRRLSHHTLGELRDRIPVEDRRGVFLTDVTRSEHQLPVRDGTVLLSGDVLRLTGVGASVSRLAKRIGYRIDPGVHADFIYLGLGLAIGLLVGKVSIGPITLGTGGGALVAGLVFGWLRAKHPTFGAYDPAAAAVIKELGLVTFIAATGLASGPQALTLIKQYGAALPVAGVLCTLVPAVTSFLIGWRLLRLEPPILLGCVAGQQCSTPAITAIQQAAGNSTPLIGYTVVYALSNVLLPLLGPVIVGLAGALV